MSELNLVAVVALRRHGVGPLGGQGVEGASAEEHDDDDHLPQGFGHFHRHLEDFRKRISDLFEKWKFEERFLNRPLHSKNG